MNFAPKPVSRAAPVPEPKAKVILFADFLPLETPESLAASELVAAGLNSGVQIITATFAQDSFAQHILSNRTPMKFRNSIAQMAQMDLLTADTVVIILDSLIKAELQSTTRYRRLKERRRNLLFLAEVLRARPDAMVIGDGVHARIYLRSAQVLSRRAGDPVHPVTLRPVSDLTGGALARQLGIRLSESKGRNAMKLLQEHVNFGLTTHRLSAQRILNGTGKQAADTDLAQLAQIATSAVLKNHPVVRRLRMLKGLREPVWHSPAPHRLLDQAMERVAEADAFGLPLTRYMIQLRQVLKLEEQFPLSSSAEARKFLNWYRTWGFERAPSKWLPMPPDMPTKREAPRRQDTSVLEALYRDVLAVLDAPEAAGNLPDPARDYLAANPSGNGPSRFAVLLAILCQIPCRILRGPAIWQASEVEHWFAANVVQTMPALAVFGRPASLTTPPAPRLEIQGLPNSSTGLGTNTQMAELMLTELELPYVLRDLDTPALGLASETGEAGDTMLKRSAVLHHVNADRIPMTLMSPEYAFRNDICHIGFLLWELDRLPKAHRLGVQMLEEIWAPSRFVADLYSQQEDTPVHLVKKGLIHLETLQALAATDFVPRDGFTTMCCFDFHSSVERKNPLATVQAFQLAFPARTHADCQLIVKTTPTSDNHWGDPMDQMGAIRKIAAQDHRIRIIDRFMPQTDLWHLMLSADCILSTHRAEGFGYVPATALAMAKPLVVTDHGGPTDFCDAQTSFPVAASLVEVPQGHALYHQPGARWADVSPDAVAQALRQVYDNPEGARERALVGQALLNADYSMAAFAARCRGRLQALGVI